MDHFRARLRSIYKGCGDAVDNTFSRFVRGYQQATTKSTKRKTPPTSPPAEEDAVFEKILENPEVQMKMTMMTDELMKKRKQAEDELKAVQNQAKQAREQLEKIRQANRPKDAEIERLKRQLRDRDRRLGEYKVTQQVIRELGGTAKRKVICAVIKKTQKRYDGVDDFTDEPRGIPAWALDEYRRASQDKMRVELKRKAKIAEVTRVKKKHPEFPCLLCEKMFRKCQMVEVNGDLLCRRCA
jgi:seryl-tRNA synthetase